MELVTGIVLAASSGLNAYLPLLVLGLGSIYTGIVKLPDFWQWLADPWVLGVISVLLLVEIVADKFQVIDNINDWIQTVLRASSGGVALSVWMSSLAADQNVENINWGLFALGFTIALVFHIAKMLVRALANFMTGGLSAPVLSTIEESASLSLSILAILLPLLALVILIILVIVAISWLKQRSKRAKQHAHNETGEILY